VASDDGDSEDLTEGTHEPRECMACRGSGRVISNLGGSPSTVPCPWCGGAGLRLIGGDAQAHWDVADGEAPVEGESGGDALEQAAAPE